eukprot:5415403-Pyramimonas_sp.AAC.1
MSSCHHVIVTGLNDDFVCNVRVGRLSERGRGRGLSVCNLTTRSDIPVFFKTQGRVDAASNDPTTAKLASARGCHSGDSWETFNQGHGAAR